MSGIDMRRVEISPAKAQEMMLRNRKNRRVRPLHVAAMARDMRAGRFMENAETIKITATGNVWDGQHRLLALIKADVTLFFWVAYGFPDDDAALHATIDTGGGANGCGYAGVRWCAERDCVCLYRSAYDAVHPGTTRRLVYVAFAVGAAGYEQRGSRRGGVTPGRVPVRGVDCEERVSEHRSGSGRPDRRGDAPDAACASLARRRGGVLVGRANRHGVGRERSPSLVDRDGGSAGEDSAGRNDVRGDEGDGRVGRGPPCPNDGLAAVGRYPADP